MDEGVIDLGNCPAYEEGVQVGSADYARNARAECRAYVQAIRKVCGHEPEGARLVITSNAHDFGTYYSVAVKFDPANQEAADYAYRCDRSAPATWAEAGMQPPGDARAR